MQFDVYLKPLLTLSRLEEVSHMFSVHFDDKLSINVRCLLFAVFLNTNNDVVCNLCTEYCEIWFFAFKRVRF